MSSGGRGDEERQPLDGILVLCPNAALCQQVHTLLISCFCVPSHRGCTQLAILAVGGQLHAASY